MAENRPHVAVLIETSRSYGRGLLRGVRRYVAEHGPWSLFVELRDLRSPAPPWLSTWRGDGILTRTGGRAMADAIEATGLPAVELRATTLGRHRPFVGVDNAAVGRRVAEHLIERGYRRFGLCELRTEQFFAQRCDNFVATLADRGFDCAVFRESTDGEATISWEHRQASLAKWISRNQTPIGIMACNDQLGYWMIDACGRAGVSVPEEVAVVGIENDESLCELADPPLSSVAFDSVEVGYEAAATLDRMMRGEPAPRYDALIPPLGIVVRGSSDTVAVDDTIVAEALRYIREHAHRKIGVQDVADAVGLSRSTLVRRFGRALNRSPHSEIRRARLNLAKRLLTETPLNLADIAGRSGFRHAQYLAQVFHEHVGETPGSYRRRTSRSLD